MYIKVSTSRGHRYARLVESFRNEDGQPRQRTLATLGRLDPGGEVDRLVRALLQAQGRDAGVLDVLALLRTMVFNRLCDPASKLGVLRWLQTVALPRGFGLEDGLVEHQHLLGAMDVLDDHAEAITERLALLMRPLIDRELSVVFYDLTTVRIHGEHRLEEDLRAFGASKDGAVARQFMLSLVQTADGLPIAHEAHPGNTAEAPTLLPMIRSLLARWPLERVVLVAERGLLSLNNLRELDGLQAELRAEARQVRLEYVLAVTAARYGEFKDALMALHEAHDSAQPWVAETLWRRATEDADGVPTEYRLVVAHDPEAAARRTKARRDQIAELVALGQQWGGRLDAQEAGRRQRGRPLSDSGAKARLYHAVRDAGLAHLIKVDLKSDVFQFTIDEARQQYLEHLDGKLLLVTNVTDVAPPEIVSRYKALADIERRFRVLKSDIEIGPVYHQLPRRIRAHALVCFLALLLHRVLRMRLRASGRAESPQRLLEQLGRIRHQTAQTADGHLVRGITEMGAVQRELFSSIGVTPPTPSAIALNAAQAAGEPAL